MPDLSIRGMFPVQERVDHRVLEMGPTPPRYEGIGIALPPLRRQERAAASVNPVCMSTTVPYWSNMQTLMEALTSSACAIAVPSKCCGEPLSIVKLNTLRIAVNHDAPLKPEECKRDE